MIKYTTIINSKKAISPVVAIALLLVVAVVAVVSFGGWFTTYSSDIFSDTETKSNAAIDDTLKIDQLIGNSLYILNNIKDDLNVTSLKIEGHICSLDSLELGLNEIDVTNCVNRIIDPNVNIVLITENAVIEKSVYFKNTVSASSLIPLGIFVSVWNTNELGISNSTQIALPIYNGGDYDFYVTGTNLVGSPVHITSYTQNILNFTSSGIQETRINGTIKGFRFANLGDKLKLYDIKQWGVLTLGNAAYYFWGCSNLEISAVDILDLTGTTTLMRAFRGTSSITTIPSMNSWDTSNVSNMNDLFNEATLFNQDISNWDTSNVTDMRYMFNNAKLFNQDIGNWNTSSVTNMNYLFTGATLFNQDIDNWDTSKVESMTRMFYESDAFNQNLSNWNTSSVIDMSMLFNGANVFNGDISTWDVSSVTDMNMMIRLTPMFNQDLSSWDVSNVTNMYSMFSGSGSFTSNLSSWDVSSVTGMDYMFSGASSFTSDLSSWDVSNVTTMVYLFYNADSFNSNLSSWNVSNVVDMYRMFYSADIFNQDLSSWDVDQVTSCTDFNTSTPVWILPQPDFVGQGSTCTP